jgi:hypoxanthine phosphoribosyltransferase
MSRMWDEPFPNCELTSDSLAMIQRKRGCCDFVTTALKSLFIECDDGHPQWSSFSRLLRDQSYPDSDVIVGITSGGWIIAQMLSVILQKPCVKMTYSRYNNKNVVQKMKLYFKGVDRNPRVILDTIPRREERVLLVDDSVGSGATMHACKQYLLQYVDVVKTFAVVCARKDEVDQLVSDKHFLIFPWGLDV